MLPQHHFDCSYPGSARNHWATLKKYAAFQTRQSSINTFDEFKNMFALTLTDMA